MRRVVAVVGLSGVGKSTLIALVGRELNMLHLQASALIKSQQAFRQENVSSSEQLRLGAVIDNQMLLIEGFRRTSAGVDDLIVFDGHTLIDGKDGPIQIPTEVFRALKCDEILVIEDEPTEILKRRQADPKRGRPLPSASILGEQQWEATSAAKRIASELRIPFSVTTPSQIKTVVSILAGRHNDSEMTR